jgi:hypothetical protein
MALGSGALENEAPRRHQTASDRREIMGQVNVNSPDRSGAGGAGAIALVAVVLGILLIAAIFFFGPGRTGTTSQPAPQQPAPNINVQPPPAPNVNVQPPPAPNVNVNPPAQAPQR